MRIVFFTTSRGLAPVHEFLQDLDKSERAKILGCLKSIEDMGLNSPRVQFRQIKGKLWEVKINGKDGGYRIFYVMIKSDNMVLLHAYKKQSQKAPKNQIATAEKRMMEVIKHETYYLSSDNQ